MDAHEQSALVLPFQPGRHGGPFLEGKEAVTAPRNDHPQPRLLQVGADAAAQIKIVVLLGREPVDRAAIMPAMARIEHHRADRSEIRNARRAHQRVDRLREIHARDVKIARIIERREREPVFDLVDPRLARSRGEVHLTSLGHQRSTTFATRHDTHTVEFRHL